MLVLFVLLLSIVFHYLMFLLVWFSDKINISSLEKWLIFFILDFCLVFHIEQIMVIFKFSIIYICICICIFIPWRRIILHLLITNFVWEIWHCCPFEHVSVVQLQLKPVSMMINERHCHFNHFYLKKD